MNQRKLLIVDDSYTNRKMLCKLLSKRGFVCEEADDGLIALNMVTMSMSKKLNDIKSNSDEETRLTTINSSKCYDAILMDFVMPNMNGPDATNKIRELGYIGPIIGVTGNALQQDHDIFIQAGASQVFTKPFEMNDLIEAINKTS